MRGSRSGGHSSNDDDDESSDDDDDDERGKTVKEVVDQIMTVFDPFGQLSPREFAEIGRPAHSGGHTDPSR